MAKGFSSELGVRSSEKKFALNLQTKYFELTFAIW
jgi:hypothetical protein